MHGLRSQGTVAGRWSRSLALVAGLLVSATMSVRAEDPLARYQAVREAVIERFRASGVADTTPLGPAVVELQSLAARSTGELQARARVELGTMVRLQGDTGRAASILTEAAEASEAHGLKDAGFNAWLGVVLARMHGASDHGGAATALERATEVAGDQPTQTQRSKLAIYGAQLLSARGEFEAALVEALNASRLAPGPEDRVYAEMEVSNSLLGLVESCVHRRLLDSLSAGENDAWGACRRAAGATHLAYERAAATAAALGWHGLVQKMYAAGDRLRLRQETLELQVSVEQAQENAVFDPKEQHDVLVSQRFWPASWPTMFQELATLAEQSVAQSEAQSGSTDARSMYLRGMIADIRGGSAQAVSDFFAQAAKLLTAERTAFFDPRRRGTAIENRSAIIRVLALRLLSTRREADAFAAFESARARGLSEISQLLTRPDVTEAERVWLARLLTLDARANEIETSVVETTIARAALEPPNEALAALEEIRAERRVLLRREAGFRARMASPGYTPAGLETLQQAAVDANIPVLLYWTTPTNLLVWYVGPRGSQVHAVFVPQNVLAKKVARVVGSMNDLGKARDPFDAAAARELYLFLLGPIRELLEDASQVLIVPQGALVGLPFEVLPGPQPGEVAIDRWVISYAPSATAALKILRSRPAPIRRIHAVVDQELDASKQVMQAITATRGLQPHVVTATAAIRDRFPMILDGAEAVHLLLHGEFNPYEPLLSKLKLGHAGAGESPVLLASELVAVPLRGIRLAVLSACEGARVGLRISNEIFGFPWALIAGGVENVVLSRWLVTGASNAAWMRHFYGAVATGASPAEAAAVAMRHMRNGEFSHPYHWAAMQVSGR